ncbi:MAG: DUF1622 domain-containing protein [Acidobacteriota bacterium]
MFLQENIQTAAKADWFPWAEKTIFAAVQWLKLGVEAVGALVIGIGAILAIYLLIIHFKDQQPTNFNRVRLTLGKYLTLALEFQLGADILSTAIAPTPQEIGKLAAIAAIRTVLNYFLTKELKEEQKREEEISTVSSDENLQSEN